MLKLRDINRNKYKIDDNSVIGWFNERGPFTLRNYQEEFLRDKSRITIGHWGRRTGKSTTLCLLAVYTAHVKSQNVVIVTPNRDIRDTIVNTCQNLSSRLGTDILRVREGELIYANGSRITVSSYSSTARTVCGVSAGLAIIDEFHFINEDVLQCIIPLISCNGDSRLVMLSSVGTSGGYWDLIDKNKTSYYKYGSTNDHLQVRS